MAHPIQQVGLAGMGAESAQGVHVGFDGNFFAENLDVFRAVHQQAAQRAYGLIANHEHMCFRLPQVRLEVVQNASAVAHARAGHNQTRAGLVVDGFGVLGGDAQLHRFEFIAHGSLGDEFQRGVIE